ncbi:MAG: UPF0182 family protein, partial [Microcoleaceae cyanobacterium]
MAVQKRVAQISLILLFALGLLLNLATYLITETLWFQEVGYLSVFLKRFVTQVILGLVGFSVTAVFLALNLSLANRYQYPLQPDPEVKPNTPYFSPLPSLPTPALRFGWFLIFVLGLAVVLGMILMSCGQVFLTYWHPDMSQSLVVPLLPDRSGIEELQQGFYPVRSWQLVTLGGIIFCFLTQSELACWAIVLFLSLGFSLVLSTHWGNVLQFLNPVAFNQTEDLFKLDIGFYIFSLPIGYLLEFWLLSLTLVGFLCCCLRYLVSGNSFSQGKFPGFSQLQQRHLHGLGGGVMLSIALALWIDRYKLLYSPRGVVFGAGYTDIMIQAPAYRVLCLIAIAIAIFLFWQAFFQIKVIQPYVDSSLKVFGLQIGLHQIGLRQKRPDVPSAPRLFANSYSLRVILGSYLALFLIAVWLLPALVQGLVVQPNELERETPYIKQNIKFTRAAFGLDQIEIRTFDPEAELTYADIQNNDLTVRNIRLWDVRPLLQTNKQLQQIRPYYAFFDADIDRYTLLKFPQQQPSNSSTERQQVLIAARELDYTSVPSEAQTWINKHLIYTHGYGFTLSPVNTVGAGGLPEYFISEIGPDPRLDPASVLQVSPRVQDSIPIGKPRIYYGELTNTNVMTSTTVQELDYPFGNENVYNVYDGTGGIVIGQGWKRYLFANRLRNWQMIFTRNFSPETKLLFRRNIVERVKAIAPFLHYDGNPYLVSAKANLAGDESDSSQQNTYLYWILDAYTTSDRYPYSDPGNTGLNYIRNSVKVVVDAYNGLVKFYYLDTPEVDPILTSWRKVFPELFKPIQEMPPSLKAHIRYPVDLLKLQSDRLLVYHMEDLKVFYNREDQWRIPREIYAGEQQPVEPYYLITGLPGEKEEEFIILQPFTPASRINLISWLAARSDEEQYGKLLLYRFPKQRLVFGPEQVEALINQNPEISEQISLWNRQGSRAVQGNLLVIPIERSLLYVEPIYIEASENSLPTLARVVVVIG